MIEYRWAGNQADQPQALGAVIATAGLVATLAAKAATSNIPSVFVVSNDPVPQFGHKRLQSQRGGKRVHGLPTPITQPRSAQDRRGFFVNFSTKVCSYM